MNTRLATPLPPLPRRNRRSRFFLRALVWLTPFIAYAASPFATAWTIKEAIKSGDSATIDRLVEWDSVRASLRRSLTSLATDRPVAATIAGNAPVPAEPPQKPGLWKRFKSYLGTNAVDSLVDRYANASGLPTLFSYGQTYKRYVAGTEEPPKTLANLPERIRAFWARVKHVEFLSPAKFEIEVEDKTDPSRHFTGLLEWRDMRWKLTELYVHTDQNPLGRLAALDARRNPLER